MKQVSVYRNVLLALAVLFVSPTAHGQITLTGVGGGQNCLAPGKEISFTATFTGPYAALLTAAMLRLNSKSSTPPSDQQDFQTSVWSLQTSKNNATPGVFTLVVKIPPAAADGEYSLTAVRAYMGEIQMDYKPPEDFKATFRVCNPTKFKWPPLQKVTQP
jgi:hypothetical protein